MLEHFDTVEAHEATYGTWIHPTDRFRADPADELRALKAEGANLLRNPSAPSCLIHDWCQRAHDRLAWLAADNSTGVGLWREMLLPFFLQSPFLRRCREKPRGYAGDYLTIQMMYDQRVQAIEGFGMAVESWAMTQPCPKAVRNRRRLVAAFVDRACENGNRGRPSIISLGCGPAAEVFDTLRYCRADFTLVDIDQEAIAFVQTKARDAGLSDHIAVQRANVIKMVLGNDCRIAEGQSAFYSLGLLDYFNDALFIRLLDYIHGKLAKGGRALLGNFRPAHANTAFFEHALEWPLILRSKSDLLRIVKQSRFADCPMNVGAEPEGVQLFIECEKA